jgi:CRP/FNR family nitrogen fixation transcriptional regulator
MPVSLAVASQGYTAPAGAFSPAPRGLPDQADGLPLSGVVSHFVSDRQIYAEGDEARAFYKVVTGMVRTCRFLGDGHRQIDSFYVVGDLFGIEAGTEHNLTAEAVSACSVIAYRRRGLETLVAGDERIGRWFFSHAMTSLARVREHALLLGHSTAAQRMSTFLLEAEARAGGDGRLELAMSRQDIADYLGLTIETVSRTFSRMERDGVIGLPTSRRIIIKDRRTLKVMNA